jgi:hypothetical protein
VIITPEESLWIGGYAFRDHPSQGKLLDVWAKALALEDKYGKRAVLVSIEISALHKTLSDEIRKRLQEKYNLSKEQLILNSTHTHSGPETNPGFLNDVVEKKKVANYAQKLEDRIIDLVGAAIKNLQPVKLFSENGVTRFQVNRRNNIEYKNHLASEFRGPNDFAVPVIKAVNESGKIIAIVFAYACHSSVLRDYRISGDYPGFAQIELEKLYPGATALFFQGAGGNQIAYPRKTDESERQYGRTLAADVERVISENMKELSANLTTSYSEVNLELFKSDPESENSSTIVSGDSDKNQKTARKGTAAETPDTIYPYPVQVWKIGEQAVITLGGEPVVEYALEVKQIFGQQAFVFGYCNDVMAYMSTPLILDEGGYEGTSSPVKGMKWGLTTAPLIIQEVLRLAKQSGLTMYNLAP